MSEDVLGENQAADHIHGICLKNGPPRRVGVELEWLVRDARDPAAPVSAERIASAVARFAAGGVSNDGAVPESGIVLPSSAAPGVLPSGSSLTTEPGGQLELSSLPADSLADCVRDAVGDMTALRAAAAEAGLELAGIGLDPYRLPRRILRLPRYAAMEAFFDRDGPWGRQMMCATASVQVCLDAGDDSDTQAGYRYRWRLLHAIGPVLVAAFANSPLREGRPTGWKSSRQQVWAHMDASRTKPPEVNGDPRADWAGYALDAQVMCVRSEGEDWSAPPGVTLRDWVRGGDGDSADTAAGHRDRSRAGGGRPGSVRPDASHDGSASLIGRLPTTTDLDYHLSTLFPPVRPRGHFEVRVIDAQRGDGWVVPLAVTTALLSDDRASDLAMAAIERIWPDGAPGTGAPVDAARGSGDERDPWILAARRGPADPAIARASRECFDAARDALARQAAPAEICHAVEEFTDSYVAQDRCPADDLLEETP